MSGRRVRGLLLLAAIGALAWWIYEKRPTFGGVVDTLIRPIMRTSAAVGGSEHKRVVGEASQVVALDEEKPIGEVRVGMTESEVRRLLGEPDEILPVDDGKVVRHQWVYRGLGRLVLFERRRVVSIAVR